MLPNAIDLDVGHLPEEGRRPIYGKQLLGHAVRTLEIDPTATKRSRRVAALHEVVKNDKAAQWHKLRVSQRTLMRHRALSWPRRPHPAGWRTRDARASPSRHRWLTPRVQLTTSAPRPLAPCAPLRVRALRHTWWPELGTVWRSRVVFCSWGCGARHSILLAAGWPCRQRWR